MALSAARYPAAILLATGPLLGSHAIAAPLEVEVPPTLELSWGTVSNPDAWSSPTIDMTLDGTDFYYEGQEQFTWGPDGDTLLINYVYGNVDPVLNFAVAVIDFGAPSFFGFSFNSPLVPTIVGQANYQLSLSGSFSDGASDGGSLGAGGNTFGIMDGLLDFVPFAGVGGAAPFATPGATYGPFVLNGVVNCGIGCNTFGADLSFLGSGGGDAFSFTGRFEINQVVPVPAAAWLFAPALGLLGFLRRRTG